MNDRGDEIVEEGGIHLTVTIDLDQNIHAICDSLLVARHHSATDTLVFGVKAHSHARVFAVRLNVAAGPVGAAIIHGVDGMHLWPDGFNHP